VKIGLSGYSHMGSSLTSRWDRKNRKAAFECRKVLSGYPITSIFSNVEDQKDYFNHERITCLLCGKQYKFLTIHLKIHALGAEDYRNRFGITLRQGLVGTITLDNQKKNTINRMAPEGDLRKIVDNLDHSHQIRDKCPKGHNKIFSVGGIKYCKICSTEFKRKKYGYLPQKNSS